jgi:hypothetical protein
LTGSEFPAVRGLFWPLSACSFQNVRNLLRFSARLDEGAHEVSLGRMALG